MPAAGRARLVSLYDPLMVLTMRERTFRSVLIATALARQLLDGFTNTRDHAAGRMPSLIAQAGFDMVRVTQRWRTLWGSLEILTAESTAP